MPARSASPPKAGPRTAPKIAAPNAVPMTSPRRSRGAVTEIHASAPAQVAVLGDPLDEPCAAERECAVGCGEGEARHGEEEKASDDCSLRPEACRSEAARDTSEQRAGPVRADEEPGAGLREVELLRVRREQRRQRREEERVDEDDRADEEEEAAHAGEDTRAKKMHRAGGVLVRPSD